MSYSPPCLPYWYSKTFECYCLLVCLFQNAPSNVVDPSKTIEHHRYTNDPDKHIYTSNYFGNFWTDPDEQYAVKNGLFAEWPVAVWTEERFGSKSELAKQSKCIASEALPFSSASCFFWRLSKVKQIPGLTLHFYISSCFFQIFYCNVYCFTARWFETNSMVLGMLVQG